MNRAKSTPIASSPAPIAASLLADSALSAISVRVARLGYHAHTLFGFLISAKQIVLNLRVFHRYQAKQFKILFTGFHSFIPSLKGPQGSCQPIASYSLDGRYFSCSFC